MHLSQAKKMREIKGLLDNADWESNDGGRTLEAEIFLKQAVYRNPLIAGK